MKKEIKDFSQKLKDLGISVFKKTEAGLKKAKENVANTILDDHLHRRFNLENPYKFQIIKDKSKTNFISSILPKNAKRYVEDDLFVFYGSMEHNNLEKGNIIRDLSINADFEIKDLLEVKVSVEYENKQYEVLGTCAVCDLL